MLIPHYFANETTTSPEGSAVSMGSLPLILPLHPDPLTALLRGIDGLMMASYSILFRSMVVHMATIPLQPTSTGQILALQPCC